MHSASTTHSPFIEVPRLHRVQFTNCLPGRIYEPVSCQLANCMECRYTPDSHTTSWLREQNLQVRSHQEHYVTVANCSSQKEGPHSGTTTLKLKSRKSLDLDQISKTKEYPSAAYSCLFVPDKVLLLHMICRDRTTDTGFVVLGIFLTYGKGENERVQVLGQSCGDTSIHHLLHSR